MRWLIAIVAPLAFAPSAYAQGATIQAGPNDVAWSPANVTIKAGESVTWSWTGFHNVKSAAWGAGEGDASPFTHQFAAAGTYTFVCQFHQAQGMVGSVTVTDAGGNPPPPPPPPPPSEQPFANDQQPPTVFELGDEVRPDLDRVRVKRVRNGARVRFRLSERARVTVRLELGGVAVKTARKTFGKGPGRLTIRDRRLHGRYTVEVLARDLSGNRSAVERDHVRIR